eukprot:gene27039-35748_t
MSHNFDCDSNNDYYNLPAGDAITAIDYDETGDYLATGSRSGKISILKVDNSSKCRTTAKTNTRIPLYEFQSHSPEFDYLKSLEIEGKINKVKFCRPTGKNLFILSTNDQTIKLWKRSCLNSPDSDVKIFHSHEKKRYAGAHSYHINSLAVNSDNETFLSADDLRINMWNLENSDTSFNILDIKPLNMEELTEVITAVQCHPSQGNTFAYSSSRGVIKVCDTRSSAICSSASKSYVHHTAKNGLVRNSFIADIVNSISDIRYSADGRFIFSRDYLSVKVWDVNMESHPVETITLHDHLHPLLEDLYESDSIFDKFEVCCRGDGKSFATGSYSNQLKVCQHDTGGLQTVDLSEDPLDDPFRDESSPTTVMSINSIAKSVEQFTPTPLGGVYAGSNSFIDNFFPEVRPDEKVLHCAWHPTSNHVAVAGRSGLCIYNA